jgi:hypothetical protein
MSINWQERERPEIVYITTELLDFLMTEDNDYLITNDSIYNTWVARPLI